MPHYSPPKKLPHPPARLPTDGTDESTRIPDWPTKRDRSCTLISAILSLMGYLVTTVSTALSILTALAGLLIVLYGVTYLLSLLSKKVRSFRVKVIHITAPYARIMAFTVSLTAMFGSLFYSEVAKYQPCILCWYQRIFMYPQTLLIAMGILKKDRNAADYAIGLSAVGAVIAAYHYFEQIAGTGILPCTAVGYSVSCTKRFALEYGYITIPMMSLTAFVAIILLMRISKRTSGKPA
jgi:disulfide bond formation protein DsbB